MQPRMVGVLLGRRRSWLALLLVLAPSGRIAAQELRLYRPYATGDDASLAVLRADGSEAVTLAMPALATIRRGDVAGATLHTRFAASPRDGRLYPLYKVVLALRERMRAELQERFDEVCGTTTGLYVVENDRILDHVAVLGCSSIEAGASFVSQAAARAFAERFSPGRVEYRVGD